MAVVRTHVVVAGRVQGVWFRQSCRERARAEGVAGWVRNRSDGAVEAVFEGEEEAVDRMLAWVAIGPPRARVDRTEVRREDPVGERSFEVR